MLVLVRYERARLEAGHFNDCKANLSDFTRQHHAYGAIVRRGAERCCLAKFALQEGYDPLDFIKILSVAFKDTVMLTLLVIDSLDGFPCRGEPFLKITSHLDLRKLCPAVRRVVARTMQDKERYFEL